MVTPKNLPETGGAIPGSSTYTSCSCKRNSPLQTSFWQQDGAKLIDRNDSFPAFCLAFAIKERGAKDYQHTLTKNSPLTEQIIKKQKSYTFRKAHAGIASP
ncbi:hypothetical protein OB13_11650 [Pontibacter sp. HJ8]